MYSRGPKIAANFKMLFYYQPRFETVVSELILVKNEAMHAINNLKKWMQPQHVERNLVRLFFFCQSADVCFCPKHPHDIVGIVFHLRNLFGVNIPSGCHKGKYCAPKED